MYLLKDSVFAVIMIVCGYLYWNLITFLNLGFGVTVFAVIFCTVTTVYLMKSGYRQTGTSLIWLGIIAASAINFCIFDNLVLKGFQFIFLSICVVYWICITTGRRLVNKLSAYLLADAVYQLFVVPFCHFTCCFRSLKLKNCSGKKLLSAGAGVLFIFPVVILVVTLLSDADAAFEGLMKHLQFSLSDRLVTGLKQLILGIPVACYLYGLIYGNSSGKRAELITVDAIDQKVLAARFAPDGSVFAAFTLLNLVFAVFFLSQLSYFFSAFGGSLPQTMTYAEYARRGFFELCAVSGINLIVISIAQLIAKKERRRIFKIQITVLCLFTIMLILTAFSKMILYIDSYGLTLLRVYTTWFMLLLLIVFMTITARQLKEFNGTKVIAVTFLILFLTLCYSNVDGFIVNYNIEQYQKGNLETIDVGAFSELSDAAVPYLYRFYQETDDDQMKAELKHLILTKPAWREERGSMTFRDWNFQQLKADRIRESINIY